MSDLIYKKAVFYIFLFNDKEIVIIIVIYCFFYIKLYEWFLFIFCLPAIKEL